MKTKPFKLVVISARRWFDKANGNTYHAVNIEIRHNRKEPIFLESGIHYGYGESYLQTACEMLCKLGYFEGKEATQGSDSYSEFLRYKMANRDKFVVFCADVNRRKDL